MPDDELHSTIQAIHAAGLDPALWPRALGAVTQLVGGVAATIEVLERQDFSYRAFFGFNVPPREELAYLEQYAAMNPRVPDALRRRRGETVWDFQILDEAGMNRSPFYQEFLARQDMRYAVAGILDTRRGELGAFAVQRSAKQGHVERREIELISRLIPHVSQALDMTSRLKTAETGRRSLEQALDWLSDGVLLVDARGKATHVNRACEVILGARDGVAIRQGVIEFRAGEARECFRAALALVHGIQENKLMPGTSDFPAARPSGSPAYLVSVRPLPIVESTRAREPSAAAMVFIRDPLAVNAASLRLLREILGLTGAEANLARALQGGVTLGEYARLHAVSLNTVYTHLRRLKDKTGCHRMPELIRKLNDLQVPLQAW